MNTSLPIKTVIIDDEMKAREILKRLLAKHCPEIEVVGEANSIDSGVEILLNQKPQLAFLDIHLDTQNSFDILTKVDSSKFKIIFTSGHNNYGIPAIKVNAIDYLLKPIDIDDLLIAVQKVSQRIEAESFHSTNSVSIPVHVNDVVEYINSTQICALEANNNYTQLVMLNGKHYIASKTLSDVEELLKDTNHFIRIHRSVCINTTFISNYSKSEPFEITLKNGSTYEISRRKRGEILAILKGMEICDSPL
jgi:two-component system, LytTR family, response regulator